MKEFTVLSPAKINLNLCVLGARRDGFHDIKSVVQPVSIFDEVRIRISKRGGVCLHTNASGMPPVEKNTAFAAADLFVKEAGIENGVEIFLKKNIPAGSGLGGGSGNAAAVLEGLNRVFGVFSDKSLCEIGNRVGADVPLFLGCCACTILGKGDRVENLDGFPLLNYVVCFPGFESRTADVYRRWDELNSSQKPRPAAEQFRTPDMRLEMANDLEPAAFSLYPKLKRFCDRLGSDYGVRFLMTGSGSAFFSVFECEDEALAVFEKIRDSGDFQCFLARGIDRWRMENGKSLFYGL